MENLLKELQNKLDTQKYYQSATARQDLSGRMDYCKNCYFQKFDNEKGYVICNLDEKSKVENQVCAKNYRRNNSESKPKTTRKRNNGKS